MKISIDTASDSKEDIKKAIKLLQSIIEHETQSRDIFSSPNTDIFGSTPAAAPAEPSANPASAFGSMFGDDAPQPESSSVETPKKKVPRIEPY